MVQTVWTFRNETDTDRRDAETQGAVTAPLQRILWSRGFRTPSEIESFISPKREQFLNPFLMKGMAEAVERLRRAASLQEKVLVHGDYDVDGITGTAIVSSALAKLGVPHETFLPERSRDGYGVSREAIRRASREGIRILVTVDCGISAKEEIEEARAAGIEALVLDHHRLPSDGLPPAKAILNPLQESCAYPFKELSAGGLAFKLAQALLGAEAFEFLDLAALSTIADMAPLHGENRVLVKEGLCALSAKKRVGLRALAETASLRAREIKASHVGFVIAPRLNAAGRMSSATTSLRLLLTPNEREAKSLARILEEENRARQREERRVTEEAIDEVERTHHFARDRVLVAAREGWHAGVIGIVASRLVERYHRPALVIAIQEGRAKGSGRSIPGFHLFNALEASREALLEFGGHEQAAGFSVEIGRIPGLRKLVNEYAHAGYPGEIFLRSIAVDWELPLAELTPRFLKELELLEPHGVGNPKPVFLTRNLFLKKVSPGIGRGRSRMWVSDGTLTYEAAVSGRGGFVFDFQPGTRFDLVYTVNQKRWEGEETVVLEVKDAKG